MGVETFEDTPEVISSESRFMTTRQGTSAFVVTSSLVDPSIALSRVPCLGRAARIMTVARWRDAYRRICSAGVEARRRERGLPTGWSWGVSASGSRTVLCDPGSTASLRRSPSRMRGGSQLGSASALESECGISSGFSSLLDDLGSHTRSTVMSSSGSRKYFRAQLHASQAASG